MLIGMSALASNLRRLAAPEEGDVVPARRSRRQWIIDSALFLAAVGFGSAGLVTSVDHGLEGPLVVVDAIGGAAVCLALWWRRRWPVTLALASLPVLAVSSSAGLAGLILLFAVAAYRRWQLALIVALGQLAVLPVARATHTQGNSLVEYYVVGPLCIVVAVVLGMF